MAHKSRGSNSPRDRIFYRFSKYVARENIYLGESKTRVVVTGRNSSPQDLGESLAAFRNSNFKFYDFPILVLGYRAFENRVFSFHPRRKER